MKKRNPYHDLPESPEEYQELRASWALGFARASEISGIAIEAILPALGGLWLDTRLGTTMVFLAVGLVLGLTAAFFHLLAFVKKLNKKP